MHGKKTIKYNITALVIAVLLNFTRTKQVTCIFELENIFTT